MAVEDKYIDTAVAAGNVGRAFATQGAQVFAMRKTFELAAADDNGSVYRLFADVNSNIIPIKVDVNCDAVTSGTDWDLGCYDVNLGAVVDKDILADGIDLSSAKVFGAELSGIVSVNISDAEKSLYELLGKTISNRKTSYDIALTANTVGSAAVTVTVTLWFVQNV